jgi:3-deoxy-D-manno-octulosonic-acid transferase
MLLKLYSLLATSIKPLLRVHLRHRLKKGKELKTRINERYGRAKRERPNGPLVWIHVASLGEAQSTIPLIQEIRKLYPHIQILISYGTVTASRMMEKRFDDSIIQQFVPLDVPKWVNRFLDHWKPSLGIWIESELWPNLLRQTKKRQIPLVFLNARLSLRSYKRWQKIPQFSKNLLSSFNLCLAQTDEMAERYKNLGASNVLTIGNFKAAADPLPFDQELITKFQKDIQGRPFWLAASTHPGEDEFIIAAHQKIAQIYPDILTFIAPRHTNRREEIRMLLQKNKLNYALRSEFKSPENDTNVYLIDTMGELGSFYKLANIVFVAGSLLKGPKPLGGHNPLEPALLECAISFGTDMGNTRDSADGLLKRDAAEEITSPKALSSWVIKLLEQPEIAKEMAEKARLYAEIQKEVLNRVMNHINPFLDLKTFEKTGFNE